MAEQIAVKTEFRVTDEELLQLLGLDPDKHRIYSVRTWYFDPSQHTIVTVVPRDAADR